MGLARPRGAQMERRFERVCWDRPEKNAYSHVADALQYLLVGGGHAAALYGTRVVGPRGGGDGRLLTLRRGHRHPPGG
jgi:hypothetical protein